MLIGIATTSAKLHFMTNTTIGMTLDDSQQLGIGTQTPGKMLDIYKSVAAGEVSARIRNTSSSGWGSMIVMGNSNSSSWTAYGTGVAGTFGGLNVAETTVIKASSDGVRFSIGTDGSLPLHFVTNDTLAMTVDASQKVGIGTISPTHTLHVDGSVRISGDIINDTVEDILVALDGYSGGGGGGDGYAPTYDITESKTGVYTAAFGEVVRCDPSGGGFTITLPAAAGGTGKVVIVKNTTSSTNTITIDGNGAETIDGQASVTIAEGYKSLTFVSYGSEWGII